MRRGLVIVMAGLALLAACGQTPEDVLRAGAGQRIVDLPVGIGLSGYATTSLFLPPPPDDPGGPAHLLPSSRGIYAAPNVKVVLFERGSERLAFAKIDASLMSAALLSRTVQLARDEAGVDLSGGRLLLNATHTHDAGHRFSEPKFYADLSGTQINDDADALAQATDSFSQEMTDRVARSLVAAIADAKASLRPAVVGHGFGENETAAHDRRCADDAVNGHGNVDHRLTVIRVDEKDGGKPIAVMFHYAMHGTMYDSKNRNVSADAPAHAEYVVEQAFETPVIALYLQGAAGDVSPSGNGFEESQGMQRVGLDLARSVLALRDTVTTTADVQLKATERWFPISREILGYQPGEFPEEGAILCQFDYDGCNHEPKDPKQVKCMSQALPGGGKHYGHVGAAQLGDLYFVALPGEPLAETARALRAGTGALGHPEAVVLGYALDHDGYLLMSDDWLRGGYEPTITFWGWKFGPYLVEQGVDLFRELVGQKPQKVRPEPVPMPDLTPRAYEPTPPSPSRQAPAVVQQPVATVRRLEEVRFAFYGGDPLLGHPEVTLERSDAGAFSPVRVHGWWTITSLHGGEMATFYAPTPTYRSQPGAIARDHHWEVTYEPPRDLPEGTYRLVARGKAVVGDKTTTYELPSDPFVVQPAALLVDPAAQVADGKLSVELRVRYPAEYPLMSTLKGNEDWQVGHFRMVDERFPPPRDGQSQFVPVVEGTAHGDAQVDTGAGAKAASITFVARPFTEGPQTWAPGAGPGFHLEQPATGGTWHVRIPAGALSDKWGNTNASEIALDSAQE